MPEELHAETIARFREHFHAQRQELVRSQGPEAFDQAQVLYICASTGRKVVIRDAFYGQQTSAAPDFVATLQGEWWASRQAFQGAEAGADADLQPVAGIYARYLGEVGFDWSVEFRPTEGAVCAWRMDGGGRIWRIEVPEDEGMFRDTTGTFLDLRAGWRWLAERHLEGGRTQLAEVQPGYVIGVRAGMPGSDPATREDPELAEALSAQDRERYDTLEFLEGAEAQGLPFHGERYADWLGPIAEQVRAAKVELFVLADASEFLACIEDLCGRWGVAVEWVDPDEDLRTALHHGDLRLEQAFSYPYLRSLHTGRSFVEGTRAFYAPALHALDEAKTMLDGVREVAGDYTVTIEDGVVLKIEEPGVDVPIGRWNLMSLAGRDLDRAGLLSVLGFDVESGRFTPRSFDLDTCPVSGGPARVNKVVRPLALLGVDPRSLVGVPIGEHLVYYTLDSETHSTPIEPGPERDLHTLESAYRDGLEDAVQRLLGASEVEGGTLLLGFEVGALVLEPARIKGVLESIGRPAGPAAFAYAFFPDALLVTPQRLGGAALKRARLAALEAVLPHYSGRTWPLNIARPIDLQVEALGVGRLE